MRCFVRKLSFKRAFPRKRIALYLLICFGMVLLNFALPQSEPLSFALFFAALACGRSFGNRAFAVGDARLRDPGRIFTARLRPLPQILP